MMSMDIKLNAFEGPLDLLLHLITREEVDIYDIPIVSITSQFLEAIGDVDELDLEFASEFIVMAATLLEIKSKMLLPDNGELEIIDYVHDDPRQELVKRLVEYKHFKDIASKLRTLEGTLDEVLFREQEDLTEYIRTVPVTALNDSMDSMLLVDAVKRLLQKMNRFDDGRQQFFKGIKRDMYTVEEKITRVRTLLLSSEAFEFNALFGEVIAREEVVVTFLALLELLKLKEIAIEQETLFGEIIIKKRHYVELEELS
ncbi:MAG: segregation/condensation protein A [Firmicutes bacterium]|nr:segregation/condensation protein A [Bacillota bacterium]